MLPVIRGVIYNGQYPIPAQLQATSLNVPQMKTNKSNMARTTEAAQEVMYFNLNDECTSK